MLIKVANDIGHERKQLLRLRHALNSIRQFERVSEFATLQLQTENFAEEMDNVFEELRLLQEKATVMAIALKRLHDPINPANSPKLLYSEATPAQREIMRSGRELPDRTGTPYNVEEIVDKTPLPKDRMPL